MYEYSKHGSTWDGSARVYGEVLRVLADLQAGAKILDAGCGNGHLTGLLASRGFVSHGVDPSESGIALARRAHADATFACADLTLDFDGLHDFDAVVCIEVIEHVYAPTQLLTTLFTALRPGGRLVLTTPYHGYLKNLALVGIGRFDRHFDPLWDHGHIKFFSADTLTHALRGAGFEQISIRGIGRVAYLWKTMLATAQKPHVSERERTP
jgi:2-polyprenyl-3-methyl-5-hydroxy-6-metoxy-1,4-benzoquinol methylase